MIVRNHTVQEVLIHNHFLEMVLERFDIRQNNKHQTLEFIFRTKETELDFLIEILNLFDSEEPFKKDNLLQYPIPVILDYLQRTHKYYLGKRLFELEHTIHKIGQEHPKDFFLTTLLNNFFTEYKTGLWEHIEMEENFLFPHINLLLEAETGKCDKDVLQLKLKNFSAQKFIAEHDDDSETRLREIISMLDYLYPINNCLCPVCIFKSQAAGFEKDLKIHALVEDEVLMPKILLIENQLIVR